MTRDLDATRSPMAFCGGELRRARVAGGMSQDQLGRALSFSGDLSGKIETCERAPSPEFAVGCDSVFPHLDGLFTRLVGLARRWDGPHPQWFLLIAAIAFLFFPGFFLLMFLTSLLP